MARKIVKKKPVQQLTSNNKDLMDILESQKLTGGQSTQILSKKYKNVETLKARNTQFNQIMDNIRKRNRVRASEKEKERYQHKTEVKIEGQASQAAQELIYVDPSRKMAVAFGDRDLLADLKSDTRGRKAVSSMAPQIEQTWLLYFKEGLQNMSRGQFEPALSNLTQSLIEEKRHEAFIARSTCFLNLGDPKRALEDASDALELIADLKENVKGGHYQTKSEKRNMIIIQVKAYHCKGEAFYALSEFEKSLIFFNRCLSLRPDMTRKFTDDVTKATKAILNSVGPNCFRTPFLNMVVNEMKNESGKSMLKCTKKVQNVNKAITAADARKPQQFLLYKSLSKAPKKKAKICTGIRRSRKAFRKAHDAALGRLSVDHGFVEEFCEEMAPFSPNAVKAATEVFAYLESRRDFWRNQDPENHKKNLGRKELRI